MPPVATKTTSGSRPSTSSASAQLEKRISTPASASRSTRQSTMPISSRRRGERDARRICPPACSVASNRTTSCPRSADTRAASSPAGPAPTTTTLRRRSARAATCGMRALAAGGGVVDAQGLVALVDAVEAVGGAHAGADRVLLAGPDLPDDVRVGDVRAGHADHVELARGDRVPGGGDVGDAGGVEHRQARGGAHLAREVEVRGRGHAHDRDDVEQRVVALDVAADDVDEVDEAGGGEAAADLEALLASSGRLSQRSSPVMRMPIRNRSPTASRIASSTRRLKRIRFSRLPPHSSSRRLVAGDQNWSGRWP